MLDLVMVLGSTLFIVLLSALIAVIVRKEWSKPHTNKFVLGIWTLIMTLALGGSLWCLFLEFKALLL